MNKEIRRKRQIEATLRFTEFMKEELRISQESGDFSALDFFGKSLIRVSAMFAFAFEGKPTEEKIAALRMLTSMMDVALERVATQLLSPEEAKAATQQFTDGEDKGNE
jgi:hypothetical protein